MGEDYVTVLGGFSLSFGRAGYGLAGTEGVSSGGEYVQNQCI